MAIYKYFSDEAHALALINKGEVLLKSLSHFRAIEDGGVRGDAGDGLLSHKPVGGLMLTMAADGSTRKMEGFSFNSTAQQDSIFVYCASNRLCSELAKRFGSPFCVEIDPEVLTKRLMVRAHPSSQLAYDQLVSGPIDYRARDAEVGVLWALPDKLALVKPEGFVWQDEFRIAIGTRNAFDAENVGLTLQSGPVPPRTTPLPRPIRLRLDSLKDHATLHRLEI